MSEKISDKQRPIEQVILGTLLLNNSAYQRISDVVEIEHFSEDAHRDIWRVISGLIIKGMPATPLTCPSYLGEREIAPGVPFSYLSVLADNGEPADVVRQYALHLREMYGRKKLYTAAKKLADMATDLPAEVKLADLLVSFEASMDEVRPDVDAQHSGREIVTLKDAVTGAVRSAADAYERRGGLSGLSTGITRLDDASGGLAPTDFIVIGGRPGAGKTSLATNIAYNVVKAGEEARLRGQEPLVVGFFSMEMSAEQLAARVLAEQTRISNARVRRGKLDEDEIESYIRAPQDSSARHVLNSVNMMIDERARLTIGQLTASARKMKKKRGRLDLVVVDYIQLMAGTSKSENRVADLTSITAGLKALAKELNAPVVALSQLSRQVEARTPPRPMMSDLRESGSIEQDADVVILIYREAYYLRQSMPREGAEGYEEHRAKYDACKFSAEVIIAKQRHGPPTSVMLGFNPELTAFTSEPPAGEEPEVKAEQRRKMRKKVSASSTEATILFGVLKSIYPRHGSGLTDEQRAEKPEFPAKGRIVPVDVAMISFAENVHGKSEIDKKIEKSFGDAMRNLRKHDTAYYTIFKKSGGAFVYMPEMDSKL